MATWFTGRAIWPILSLPGLVALLATARPGVVAAQGQPSLFDEDQVVVGATKRPQPLSETPSSVSVITATEIRAQGYRTLADALRWVRGLFVTYDRNYSYLGVRGVLRPGDYDNKVLLTIDGHTVNGNLYGEAPIGTELGLDMETVDRIEIVRGPGSALYGSNAALAVVNVVTRPPERDPGAWLSVSGGTGGEERVAATASSARPGRPAWSVAASYMRRRGQDLYFQEMDGPLTAFGHAVGADGEEAANLLATAEGRGIRAVVKLSSRMKRVPTGAYGTVFGDGRTRTWDGENFAEIAGTRALGAAVELDGRIYWDARRYHGDYLYGSDGATVENHDLGTGDALGAEWRANWAVTPRQVLVGGVEVKREVRNLQRNYDGDPYALYVDVNTPRTLAAVYALSEYRFVNRIRVTAGTRLDDYPRFGAVLSPRLDLVWPRGATTWKLLTGSAFRAPTPYETDYAAEDQRSNRALRPERALVVEAQVERSIGPFSAILDAYRGHLHNVIDLARVDSAGIQFQNRSHYHPQGVEAELDYAGPVGTRARAAVAFQRVREEGTNGDVTNSPRWNAHLVVTHAPEGARTSFGAGLRYLSPRATLAGRRTAAALVADARVGVTLAGGAEAAVEMRNITDARYGDPGSGEHPEDQIPQDGRTVRVALTFHPGRRL